MRGKRKMQRMITVILTYVMLITFIIPMQDAQARTKVKRKNPKNIENGYVFSILQYENNFLLEYDSPIEAFRQVRKNGEKITKEQNLEFYRGNSRYSLVYDKSDYSYESKLLDLKDFSLKNTETEKVYKKLKEEYKDYRDISINVEANDVTEKGEIIYWYTVSENNDDEYRTIARGIFINNKKYDFSTLDDRYILGCDKIGDYVIVAYKEYKGYETQYVLEIRNVNNNEKKRVDLFQTATYFSMTVKGNQIIFNTKYGYSSVYEAIKYSFTNGNVKQVERVNSNTPIEIDKNGELWSVNKNKLIKYENGQAKEKQTLDAEYKGLYIYDENRYIVDNNDTKKMKVVYPDLAKTEWRYIDNKWYYYEDGIWQKGWKFTDGTYYYLGEDGVMRTGWQWINDAYYYFDNSGRMQEEFTKVGDEIYYLGEDGAMRTEGWHLIEDEYYYVTSNGSLKIGWFWDGLNWYHLDGLGKMSRDIREIDGENYYFDRNGAMQTGWIDDGYYEEAGEYEDLIWTSIWIYGDSSGKLTQGWAWIDNNYYYFNEDNHMVTGWQGINGKWYYLEDNGKMLTGWQYIDSSWYCFTSGGDMYSGWQFLDNKWYYFGNDGCMRTGWQWIDENWYCFTYSGDMITNKVVDGWYIGYDGIAKLA